MPAAGTHPHNGTLAERERQRETDKIGVGIGIGVEKEIGMAFGHEKLDVYAERE